jgi:tetratricopeptide (TPR) repeat protein
MKCPGCGLFHPPQYEKCVSCGANLHAAPDDSSPEEEKPGMQVVTTERPESEDAEMEARRARRAQERERKEERREERRMRADTPEEQPKSLRRSKNLSHAFRSSVPTMLGVLMATTVLLVSAGATIFFLTKAPDDQRLYVQGQKELANGQYAFAVKDLTQASAMRPKDPKIFLSLARAYVGVDQVDKAWDCISTAQQLGSGVVQEPALASDLANYYRQRQQYERAIDLLRPLAKADIAGKKAELADLDALWGDEALRNGKTEQALRCWEEVRDLREGSRFGEAESRLATIYQKMANTLASKNDDSGALNYLNKLNNIAQNARNYEMASDIYVRGGKLELAIDQLRKARQLSSKNAVLDQKLARLLEKRGKELLDEGNSDAGYGYLQQAKDMNPENAVSTDIACRHVTVSGGRSPRITGEVWNPTENSINALNLKVELFDNANSKVLWTKEVHVIDDFTSALGNQESKSFDITAGVPVKSDGSSEFRVYLNGNLYKEYTIGEKPREKDSTIGGGDDSKSGAPAVKPQVAPPVAPSVVKEETTPPAAAPTPGQTETPATNNKGGSAEEKTMKDLDL